MEITIPVSGDYTSTKSRTAAPVPCPFYHTTPKEWIKIHNTQHDANYNEWEKKYRQPKKRGTSFQKREFREFIGVF